MFCRSGARMPVRAWAELATLAKSAVAYNSGTLNRAREAGVQYLQVFDGVGCGWTSHKDPDKATGTLRTVEDAAAWPIPASLRAGVRAQAGRHTGRMNDAQYVGPWRDLDN
ncbi:hypothetical protein [Streptomyces sp. NPDC002205]|uniref:hypothetical protein n=1 Tax=Streptomyces sp. NPDC002205 TaxID=3154411 RepID=UPI003323542E